MATRCYGCMKMKESDPICEHCGYDSGCQNSSHQLPAGTLVGGQYILGRVLGQGGFGITYMGYDRIMDQPVAVKEYFPSGYAGRDIRNSTYVTSYDNANSDAFEANKRRFLREAESLAKLWNIPQIVRVLRHFEENGTAYIAMEYVEGMDLRKFMKRRNRPLTMEELLNILGPVIQALEHVHGADLVHRDISPDNIMVLPDGSSKLLDFGAARYVENADAEKDRNTSTQAILKHGFAPPEQYRSRGALGPWTDIYAMCATVYFCVTGRIPPESMSRMMGEGELELDSIPGLTAQQRYALEKGMSLMPKERTQSAGALYQGLFSEVITAREKARLAEAARKTRELEHAHRLEEANRQEQIRIEAALKKEQAKKEAEQRRKEEALRKEAASAARERRRLEEKQQKEASGKRNQDNRRKEKDGREGSVRKPKWLAAAAAGLVAVAAAAALFFTKTADPDPRPQPEHPAPAATVTAPASGAAFPTFNTPAAKDVTIQVAVSESGYGSRIWADVCEAFTEVTGIHVELITDKNLEDVISGPMRNGAFPDVVHLPTGRPAGLTEQLVKAHALHPLTNMLSLTVPGETAKVADKIAGGFTDNNIVVPYGDGVTYMAPMFYSPCGLFYNAKLFEEKGWEVPTTWDGMWALGETAKAEGIALFTYPTAGYYDAFMFALMNAIGGPEFFNAITTYEDGAWDSENGQTLLNILDKLAAYTHPNTPAQANYQDYTQNQLMVMQNQALFMPNGPWIMDEMAGALNTLKNAFAWGMTAVPSAGTAPYAYCWFEQAWIPAGAEHITEAELFVAFLYSDRAAGIFASAGAMQPILGLADRLVGDNVMLFSIYDNGARAAMGDFAPFGAIPGVDVPSTFFAPIDSLVAGTITIADYANLVKTNSALMRANLKD